MNEQVGARRGWYVVAVLCLLYVLSAVDRSILSVTATGVSASLALSDTELSLIIGAGFALVYSAIGIPAAHWMDNGDRRLGVIVGVLIWSAATAASGFAVGFWSLLACRAGVAVGEAVLTPAAVSLIADMFSPDRRTAPMTAYAAFGAVMAMGGLIGGAAVLGIGEGLSDDFGLEPWRITLMLLGIPGAILALLVLLTVKEPPRMSWGLIEKAEDGTVKEFIRYILEHRRFFFPFVLGSGVSALFPFAMMVWSPTLLVREHGFDQAGAASMIGTFGVAFSVVGTLFWPFLAKVLDARMSGRGGVIALSCAAGAAALALLGPISSDSRLLAAGAGWSMACFAAWSVLPPLIIQRFVPSRMRARTMALTMFFIAAIGYSFGPLAAASLAGFWTGDASLRYGLVALGATAIPISLLCYLACLRGSQVLLSAKASASPKLEGALLTREGE